MRYFISTLNNVYELEQKIKKNEQKEKVFQVVLRDGSHIKRFTWFLLKNNLMFKRQPLGSGIAIFFVDMAGKFFIEG